MEIDFRFFGSLAEQAVLLSVNACKSASVRSIEPFSNSKRGYWSENKRPFYAASG
jgi:hypothetical protein